MKRISKHRIDVTEWWLGTESFEDITKAFSECKLSEIETFFDEVLPDMLESHYLKEITQCLRMAFDADDLDLAFLNSWPYNHRDPGDKTIDRNNPLLLRFEVPLSKSTADSPVWAVDINEIVDSAIKIRSILIPQADPEEDDAQVKFLRSLSQAFRSLADKIDLSLED